MNRLLINRFQIQVQAAHHMNLTPFSGQRGVAPILRTGFMRVKLGFPSIVDSQQRATRIELAFSAWEAVFLH